MEIFRIVFAKSLLEDSHYQNNKNLTVINHGLPDDMHVSTRGLGAPPGHEFTLEALWPSLLLIPRPSIEFLDKWGAPNHQEIQKSSENTEGNTVRRSWNCAFQ